MLTFPCDELNIDKCSLGQYLSAENWVDLMSWIVIGTSVGTSSSSDVSRLHTRGLMQSVERLHQALQSDGNEGDDDALQHAMITWL